MARIRTIKPEFFTSEPMAAVPISARLTFIGLWTYVDDNGVGQDNERLILAALYPLDDDLLDALQRLRADLQSLSEVGVITRYEASGRRFLHIKSWTEHQKISHPRAARYPLPPEPLTSDDAPPPEERQSPPEERPSPRDSLRPEQGAGSREQGRGAGEIGSVSEAPHQAPASSKKKPRGVYVGGEWVNSPIVCGEHPDIELNSNGLCRWCEAVRKAKSA